MTRKEAEQRLLEMLPEMVENYGMKEISYIDYQDNVGNSDTADRLFNEFRRYRDRHNEYVEELDKLKGIIQDSDFVSKAIDKARKDAAK